MTQTPSSPSEPASTSEVSSDDRNLALLAHLLGIFTGFLGALIIWLIKKDSSPYVNEQAKEALNFQITVAIAALVCSVLTFVIIGCFLLPVVMLVNLILCIMATVACSRGEHYRYPFALRLIS